MTETLSAATVPLREREDMPLHGVTVVACEVMVALPFGTQLLADLGADVIDIEHVQYRDDANSRWRLRTGRHKRRIAVDLRDPRGQDIVRALCAQSDVFAENYRPGIMDKYRLGYKDLKALNPKLIYASMSGFGHRDFLPSDLSDNAAFGPVAEAMGGVSSTLGAGTHTGNEALALGDITSSLFVTVGILAALRGRDRNGGDGQYVDVAMADCLLALSERYILMDTLREFDRQRSPDGIVNEPLPSGFGSFDLEASDGRYVFTIMDSTYAAHWGNFCNLVGHPEWITEPKLMALETRRDAVKTLVTPAVNEWASTKTKVEVAELLRGAGIAAAPVLTAPEIKTEPHFESRRMLVDVLDEYGDLMRVAANPIKLSRLEAGGPQPPPKISTPGGDTREILCTRLGMDDDTVEDLLAKRLVAE